MANDLQSTVLRVPALELPVTLESLTDLNKALADSLRLQILRLLKNESFGVLELCRILEIRQPALSHHFGCSRTSHLVCWNSAVS